MTAPLRVGVCADFPEERWPSMDRVAAALCDELATGHRGAIAAVRVCPTFLRVGTRVPVAGRSRTAFNADRFINRFWRYPMHASAIASCYDVFHVVDHSYAHLVHALPPRRTVVTCHDLDAFRSVLTPHAERRSGAFRAMTRDVLAGLQRAALVMCDTAAVAAELDRRGVVPADRLVVAPLGVDDRFFRPADSGAAAKAASLAPIADDAVEILHVGTTAPRKRIDVLLRVCAALAAEFPVHLTRVGDPLTPDQRDVLDEASPGPKVTTIHAIDDETLVALYQRATLVLQPSEREGFGLPVLEALAAGTPVVASDLEVLREVGGSSVAYCPVGDIDAWRQAAAALIVERRRDRDRFEQRREAGRQQARRFTWRRYASAAADVYRTVGGQSTADRAVEQGWQQAHA